MTLPNRRGQAAVEVAAVLPIILVIVAGLYAACRTGFLASAAASAAQTEALRAGRGMPDIGRRIAADLLPGGEGASVRSDAGRSARVLPRPFPTLAGRSTAIVTVNKPWTETGAIGGFAPLALERRCDLSADCWTASSRSGRNIRRVIRARVVLGAIR